MIWAALLAGLAGYVDAICYLRLGGAFAANMTGNLVEVGIAAAQGKWLTALWCASLLLAFLAGVLAARLGLRAHRSPRLSLAIEAAMLAAAATSFLGGAAVPLLSAAMGLQNESMIHGVVAVNVAFVTGDIQQLGERLVGEIAPGARKDHRRPRIILTVLCCYALGAGIGTLAARWGAAALIAPASLIGAAAALPMSWTGLAGRRDQDGAETR